MSAPTHTAPPFGRALVAVTMFAGLAWAGDAVALVMTLDGASIVPVATVTAVVAATLTVAVLAIWVLSRIQRGAASRDESEGTLADVYELGRRAARLPRRD